MDKLPINLIKHWSSIESIQEYFDRMGVCIGDASDEKFEFFNNKYEKTVERRIAYCKRIFEKHRSPVVAYTLAELYNEHDPEEAPEDAPSKRYVCYYCMKTILLDRDHAAAWALLADAYSFIALFYIEGSEDDIFDDEDVRYFKDELEAKVLSLVSDPRIVSGESQLDEDEKISRKNWDRAICCIRKAISIDLSNEHYKKELNGYCYQRNISHKVKETSDER